MVSMIEIGMIILLMMFCAAVITSYVFLYQEKSKYNISTTTKGMNAIGEGKTINLTCPSGQVISFKNLNTHTTRGALVALGDTTTCDPFYQQTGQTDNFFNPQTTIDLLGSTSPFDLKSCEGKTSCKFTIPTKSQIKSAVPGICLGITTGDIGLIGTYDCTPS